MNVAEPSNLLAWEGWLQPSTDISVMDVVGLSGLRRDSSDEPNATYFPVARAASADVDDLDELARNWLTYWLLEMGTRDFEEQLAGWQRPDFLQMPELS